MCAQVSERGNGCELACERGSSGAPKRRGENPPRDRWTRIHFGMSEAEMVCFFFAPFVLLLSCSPKRRWKNQKFLVFSFFFCDFLTPFFFIVAISCFFARFSRFFLYRVVCPWIYTLKVISVLKWASSSFWEHPEVPDLDQNKNDSINESSIVSKWSIHIFTKNEIPSTWSLVTC